MGILAACCPFFPLTISPICIYIYIYIYIKEMSACLSVYVCLSVCMFLPLLSLICAGDFFETWHDDRFGPNLKHGLKKGRENDYHGNNK